MECRGWENKNPINRRKRQMNLHELALLIGKDKCTFPSIFQAIHVIGRGLTDTTLSFFKKSFIMGAKIRKCK